MKTIEIRARIIIPVADDTNPLEVVEDFWDKVFLDIEGWEMDIEPLEDGAFCDGKPIERDVPRHKDHRDLA